MMTKNMSPQRHCSALSSCQYNNNMSYSSVLVLRSSCLVTNDAEERKNSGGSDKHHDTSDGDTTSMLQQTLHSLPITCDITVLPEIPLVSHVSTSENYRRSLQDDTNHAHSSDHHDDIRMERQALHSCGMDNVLLLQDLPPANSESYLLSLSSCHVQVSQDLMKEAGMTLVDATKNPFMLPIPAVPSTFSFRLLNESSPSVSQKSSSGGVVVGPASKAVELQVAFDYSLAMNRLESAVSEAVAIEPAASRTTNLIVQEESIMKEKDSLPATSDVHLPVQSEETSCHFPTHHQEHIMHSAHDPHHQQNEQLLHVIRELAEKEARHLDCMLVGLGLVFVVLLVHYARSVLPMVRARKKQRQTSVASATVEQRVARDASGNQGNTNRRPPVSSVTFLRSNDATEKNSTVPLLVEEQHQQTTFSTEHGVAASPTSPKSNSPLFVASESTIGMAETSSLSSASARDQFTFLPTTDYSPPKKHAVVDKENVRPTNTQHQQLSPCSKLAQRWMETKEQRRQSRKQGGDSSINERDYHVISPVAQVGVAPTVLHESPTNIPQPQQVLRQVPMPTRHEDNTTTPRLALEESRNNKALVTPETCLVSQESFLQDYWGESN